MLAGNANKGLAALNADQNRSIWHTVQNDHRHYYFGNRLVRMAIVFGGGAVIANSSIDEEIMTRYQDRIRSSVTDEFASFAKVFGEGRYLIPLSLVAASTHFIFDPEMGASAIADWGKRAARAYLVGGTAMLAMQRLSGASRPGETDHGSHWKPFDDDNGVSGHAFVGAVPFLTIARMSKNSIIKYLFYGLSGLTAWSRVNDNKHYVSQAVLGWYMGWEATDAVFSTDDKVNNVVFSPLLNHRYYGFYIGFRL